jgi:hypothetical protein
VGHADECVRMRRTQSAAISWNIPGNPELPWITEGWIGEKIDVTYSLSKNLSSI